MSLYEIVRKAFWTEYQAEPHFVVRAPGRVNLIGEHTDYNDGYVFPMAIDRAVWIALRARADGKVRVRSLDFNADHEFTLGAIRKGGHDWIEYVKGSAWALSEAGYRLEGWDGVLAGDVPIGSGLSSSAATEVATARAFAAVSGFEWNAPVMARICQRAENKWVGVNCGIMDQMISAGGQADHALFIDCRSLNSTVAPIPEGFRIIVLDSAAPRTLAGSAYNRRRAECESAVVKLQAVWPEIRALRDVTPAMLEAEQRHLTGDELRRARHVVSENARTAESVEVLRRGDAEQFGRMMVASHESLRDDYEVSSKELDALVELSLATPGVLGARLTGAGFGGCAIALATAEKADAAAGSIISAYRSRTGRNGSSFVTSASGGASIAADSSVGRRA